MPRLVRNCLARSSAVEVLDVGPPCDSTTSGGRSPGGSLEVPVDRRVEERSRRAATGRREGDGLRPRDVRRIGRDGAAGARDLERLERLGVEADDRRRTVRSAGDRRHRALRHDDALELGERRGDLADEMVLADVEQPVAAVASRDRHDAAVGEECVRRTPEHPRRIGELRLGRRERVQTRPLGEAVQVPPAAAVAGEVELAVGRPLRLGDRLVDAAGRQLGRPQRPVGGDRRDPQPRGVPRHVGVVPLEPGEPVGGRRQARRGDEVGAADEDLWGRLAIEGNGDQLVPWLAVAGMVLADREEAPPWSVEAQVGVAVRPGRRDRDRHGRARIDPVQPAVAELGVDDDAAGHRVRPAAVLVGARPDVGRGRRQLRRLACGLAADEDPAAALRWMALDPVQVVAIEPRLAEQDGLLDDLLDRDRRAPRAVRRDGSLGRHPLRFRAATRRRRRPAPASSARARSRARPA